MTQPKTSRLVRIVQLLAVILLVMPLTGCLAAVAAAGVGIVGYTQFDRNENTAEYPTDLETTWRATLAAMDELGYGEREVEWINETTAKIEWLEQKDEHEKNDISVTLERHPEMTRVIVRIGTFYTEEHRRKAWLIFDAIESELGLGDD